MLFVTFPPPKTFEVEEGRTGLIVVLASPNTNVLFVSTLGLGALPPIDEVLPKTNPPAGLLASGFMLPALEPKLNVGDG